MKKLLTVLLLLCMVVTGIPVSAAEGETTPTVEIGTYIGLGKYNGKSIIWRCVDIDENGTLMLADRIVDTLPYDARTNDNDRSSHTVETISVIHMVPIIGKTAICAHGSILPLLRAR